MPNDDETFELKFFVYAEVGSEIFMRFQQKYQKGDWFYTFNTANVMKRTIHPNQYFLRGQNVFPISGALLVKLKEKFLFIVPSFPLGVAMPSDKTFELHLHRHPGKDDQLGLGSYQEDIYAVEHSFSISLRSLNLTDLWLGFLSHRASPYISFLSGANFSIAESYSESQVFTEPWAYKTEHSLLPNSNCLYISSLNERKGKQICTLLNICDSPQQFDLSGFEALEELDLSGNPLKSVNPIKGGQEIEFLVNKNSGKSVVDFEEKVGRGTIKPFALHSFGVRTGQSSEPKIVFDDNNMSVNVEPEPVGGYYLTLGFYGVTWFVLVLIAYYYFTLSRKNKRNIEEEVEIEEVYEGNERVYEDTIVYSKARF